MLAPSFLGMQSMPLSAVWPVAADHMMAAVRPSVGCLAAAVSFNRSGKQNSCCADFMVNSLEMLTNSVRQLAIFSYKVACIHKRAND